MEDKIKNGVFYIMVNLNWDKQPDYYIMLPEEVREFHKQYSTRGIVDLRPVDRDGRFSNKWGKIK